MPISQICDTIKCTGCAACLSVCPKKCITMVEDQMGFTYPKIDQTTCISCGNCKRVCQVNHSVRKNEESKFYMGWHKDHDVLMQSSSGGAFSALASIALEKNGVVIGAAMDQKSRIVRHIAIESEDEMPLLRLSKYYQSDTTGIYEITRAYLQAGRFVLFSGTACQIAALYSYLGEKRDYDNLLTVDVLCHGVTSRKVVLKYIENRERKYNNHVEKIFFRVKGDREWKNGGGTNIKLFFTNSRIIVQDRMKEPFFIAFNHDQILRESCYQCLYTGQKRTSDFTIADYWGVNDDLVGEDQLNNGISAIAANSARGKDFIDEIETRLNIFPTDREQVVSHNRAFSEPASRPAERDVVYRCIDKMDYGKLINKINRHYLISVHLKSGIKTIFGETFYERFKSCFR